MTGAPNPRTALALLLSTAMVAPAAAQATDKDDTPVIVISGSRDRPVETPPTESTTVIGSEVLERKQAASVFEVVKDAPGISIDGGPRTTGMKFNIRGFRGNEDVLFKIDGGIKGFEKYRFGSGVFIEPELIRSITIERGPSILTGSGAIGGAIIATTKSAADFLSAGERVGGLVKLGYNDNNRERLRMLTAFARPTERTDFLVSVVRRDSSDFKLASGERFPASATQLEGSLIKFGWMPVDDLWLELSRTGYRSGPTYTPFDANSSNAMVGGYVHQKIDDETYNLRFTYEPPASWIKLRGTLARETTALDNEMRSGPGESSFVVPCADPCTWGPLGPATGNMLDQWNYTITTAEVFNDTRWSWGAIGGVLTVGMQAVKSERDLQRLTENPLMNGPDGRYPGGFDPQQPPGTRHSAAAIVQNAFTWRDFTLTPGARVDRLRLEAGGQAAVDRQALGEPVSYRIERTTPSLSLSWHPDNQWWLTWRWIKSFRPPLITDYFGLDSASPCGGLFYNGQRVAPNGCGDRVVPTESLNREVTLAWAPPRSAQGVTHRARLTLYRIDSTRLNGGAYLAVPEGVVIQPWSEERRGLELEASHDRPEWNASVTVGRILAERRNALDDSAVAFTAGIPGTTVTLSGAYRLFDDRLEVGYRLRQLWDQKLFDGTGLTETTQYCGRVTSKGVVHAANTQQDVFAYWKPHHKLTLQLGVNNIFNKHWCNNGDELGNIIGLQGPGRSVRMSMTVQY